MRQFVTFHMPNRSQVKIKTIYYWTESKYTNLMNPNFSIHRSMCTSQNEDIRLPPLMWKQREDGKNGGFSILRMLQTYYLLRSIDKDFRIIEFVQGVRQAIEVISDALTTQRYEVLNGIVTENAITILKYNVKNLTQSQRDLISIEGASILLVPELIKIRVFEDKTMVEIGLNGLYLKSLEISEYYLLSFNYIFQRIYTNNEGGTWMAKLVNHTTDII